MPALWSVLTPVFLLIHIVPGDPVEQMLGEGAAPDKVAQLRDALGLALPFDVQYGRYLWQLAHGDFGQSFKFQASVRRVIFFFEGYPATLQLVFSPTGLRRHRHSLAAATARRLTALAEGVLSE